MNQSLAEFHGTQLSIIDHGGKKWLTAEEVGQCLGYSEANARQGVNNLFKRHEDEFTEDDTCVINLMTQGQNREVRIYSEPGCKLIAFFSNTRIAKDFRAWAKVALSQTAIVAPATPLEASMERLAGHMGDLAAGMNTVLTQLDVTRRYIGLLEINQNGRVRVTPTVKAHIRALKAEGMTHADIARITRVSRTVVVLVVNGQYPETQVTDESPVTVAERLDAWIEREQAKVCGTLADLTKGGAA